MPRSNIAVLSSLGVESLGTGGALSPYVEVPAQQDTDGYVWQTKYTPNPQLIWVFLNGQRLHMFSPSGDPQYTLDGRILTLNSPVDLADSGDGDWLEVWYFRKGATGTGLGSGKARRFGIGVVGGPGTGAALGRRIDWLESRVQLNLIIPPAAGGTVTIGSITYLFVNSITSGGDLIPNLVAIGGNIISNLDAAINATPGYSGVGGAYSSATTANPDVMSAGYGQLKVLAGSTLDPIPLTSSVPGKIQFALPSDYHDFQGVSHMTDGRMVDGDSVTIGSRTYVFKDTINNATPYQIWNSTSGDPGSDLDTPIRRLVEAINGGFGSGTTYSSATTANPDVTASYDPASENMALQSKAGGHVLVALSESTGGRFFWASSDLEGSSGSSLDNIDCGNLPIHNILGDLTVVFWCKFSADSAGWIVVHGVNTSGPGGAFAIGVTSDSNGFNILYLHDTGGGGAHEQNEFFTMIGDDVWSCIAIVRNASAKTVKLYLGHSPDDLVLIDTWTYTTAPVDSEGDSRLMLGNFPGGTGGAINPAGFIGTLQQTWIYNAQLSLDGIKNALRGNPSFANMVAGFPMGDDPETDVTGNTEGVVTGTTLVQGHE